MNASLRPADGLHAGPPDAGLATLALAQWPGDVAILGTDLRMEWINDRFAQRIGFSPTTCIGLDWPARCVRGSTPATCGARQGMRTWRGSKAGVGQRSGNCSSSWRMICDTAKSRNHLRSDGTTYHGAWSVLQRAIAASKACW